MSVRNTRRPHDVRLLDDIVDALIWRHGIVASDLTRQCDGKSVPANEGWDGKVEQLALAKARTLAPETLGRIVYAIPDAALYFVHCGTWLGKYESGPYLLQQIAATAMVCRIRAKLGVDSGVMNFTPHQTGEAA